MEGGIDLQTLDLYAETSALEEVTIAHRMSPQLHRIRLYGSPDALAHVRYIQVGHRPDYRDLALILLSGLLAILLLLEIVSDSVMLIPWSQTWYRLRGVYHKLVPQVLQVLMAMAGVAMALWAPMLPLRLIGIGLMLLTALMHSELSMLLPVALIPLAPLQINLGGLHFCGAGGRSLDRLGRARLESGFGPRAAETAGSDLA